MTPVVIIMQSSPLLLIVRDTANLTCMGMSGPRLELTWDRDGTVVANGTMGNGILQHGFTANNDTFGTYTCTDTIDDMGYLNQYMLLVGVICPTCVCVHACMRACDCMHEYMCAHTLSHIYVNACVHVRIHSYAHTHTCVCTYAHTRTYLCVCVRVCVCVCVCVYM